MKKLVISLFIICSNSYIHAAAGSAGNPWSKAESPHASELTYRPPYHKAEERDMQEAIRLSLETSREQPRIVIHRPDSPDSDPECPILDRESEMFQIYEKVRLLRTHIVELQHTNAGLFKENTALKKQIATLHSTIADMENDQRLVSKELLDVQSKFLSQ